MGAEATGKPEKFALPGAGEILDSSTEEDPTQPEVATASILIIARK